MSAALSALVFSFAMTLPPAWVETHGSGCEKTGECEPMIARESRLRDFSEQVSLVAQSREDAIILTVLAWEETKLARYTLNDCETRPPKASGDCDRDPKTGKVRARGYWQLWERSCPALWATPTGSRESVLEGAKCALRLFKAGQASCKRKGVKDPLEAGFAGYRSSLVCFWEPAKARAVRLRKSLKQ